MKQSDVMAYVLAQCPPPANPNDWVGRQVNLDQCMKPLVESLGYVGCYECLGGRAAVLGDDDSGPCPVCQGTAVVPLTEAIT